jgi:hypothetical protein
MNVETPILLLVFNRPDTTRAVLDALRPLKPKYIYVGADGPRKGKEGEQEKCEAVRALFKTIDWDCELKTNFREHNLGCGYAASQAISWFFQHVEQGIIIEDDCVPHPSFFTFCAEMLEKYKNDERIMHISGNNFLKRKYNSNESYYFTKYFTCWGWATWRRAWQLYDFNMPFLNDFLSSANFKNLSLNKKQEDYWLYIADLVRDGKRDKLDTWDYQWLFCCWHYNALGVTPVVNLVTNIGFGEDATHTVNDSKVGYVKTRAIEKIIHPTQMVRNRKVDMETFNTYFVPSQHLNQIRKTFYMIMPKPIMRLLRAIKRKIFPELK